MPLPEGWETLGPITISSKLKKAFKDIYKRKMEKRITELITGDVEKVNPNWNKVEKT